MKAIKGNRSYTLVDESQKEFYKKQGFDIIGDKGEIIEYGAGKTVPYEKYKKLEEENSQLKETLKRQEEKVSESDTETKTLEEMTIEELEVYAKNKGINIGKSKTKESILEKIKKAEEGSNE